MQVIMVKMQMLAVLALIVCAQFVFADAIVPNTHQIKKCVKIVNLDEFSDIYLIGSYNQLVGGGTLNNYIVTSGACLGKGYKFNSLSIYWAEKEYMDSVGIGNLKTKSAQRGENYWTDVLDDPNVHFITSSIEPYGRWVDNSNMTTNESIDYVILEDAEGNLGLEILTQTIVMADGSRWIMQNNYVDYSKINETDNETQPAPRPPASEEAQNGFWESFVCFFVQLFGGKC